MMGMVGPTGRIGQKGEPGKNGADGVNGARGLPVSITIHLHKSQSFLKFTVNV